MTFLPLDMTNYEAIAREIEEVADQYRKVVSSGDGRRLESLTAAIEERIDQLQRFYFDNDLDERALLFEKQRVHLRKLLMHTQPDDSMNHAMNNNDSSRKGKFESLAGVRATKSQLLREQLTHGGDKQSLSDSKLNKSKVAAIYGWEKGSDGENLKISPPNDRSSNRVGTAPSTFAFQILLTPAEYKELMDRRARLGKAPAKAFLSKGAGRTSAGSNRPASQTIANNNSFLSSSGPYVDKSLYRAFRDNEDRGKWLGGDFVAGGKPATLENNSSEGNVLSKGPYAESSFQNALRK